LATDEIDIKGDLFGLTRSISVFESLLKFMDEEVTNVDVVEHPVIELSKRCLF
jgi:hypothetical protein